MFCLQLVAHQQQKDPNFIALWTDAENAFDEIWAAQLGVDLDRLIIQRYSPETDVMERLLDQALDLLGAVQGIGLWVIDSIGGLVPKGDVYTSKGEDKSLEGTNMLNLQRKLGEFYRKANIKIAPKASLGQTGTAVILIGQVYTVPEAKVTLEAVKGGNAVKHWAHLRLLFRRAPKLDWPEAISVEGIDGKARKVHPGWKGRIKVDKTRINDNESQEVYLTFLHGKGFDSNSATITAALGLGVVTRGGAWYYCDLLPNGKIKGKETFISYFMGDEEAFTKLKALVDKAALGQHISSELEEKEIENE